MKTYPTNPSRAKLTTGHRKLGEVCDILDNLRKPVTRRDRNPGPCPYYGATGVQDYISGYIFDEDLVLVGEDGARWDAGDNSAYKISGKSWVNNHAHVLRPHRNILLDDWLVYFLNISDLSEYITGTTVKKLNQAKLRSIEIPIPPLEVQKKIVAKLERALQKISEAKKLRAEAQSAAQNLLPAELHKIFSEGKNKGWEEKEINDVCKHPQYGFTASSTREQTGPKFLRITDIQEGKVNWQIVPYCKCSDPDKYKLAKGDIVFARTGATVGKSYLISEVPKEAIYASYLIRLRMKDGVIPEFLYYFFQSEEYWEQITNEQVGMAQPNVNGSKLGKIKIPLPPLAEQKKIVARLDSLSEKIEKIKNLQSATQNDFVSLEQSVLQQAFN